MLVGVRGVQHSDHVFVTLDCLIIVVSLNIFSPHQCGTSSILGHLGMPSFQKSAVFLNIVQTGGGQPMFKNFVGNCRSFWRSFNNMKFAWKGTFEAWMVKFGGEIGTLYQIFTPCTPLPKYKRAFTWFLGGSNSLPGCRRIFYRGLLCIWTLTSSNNCKCFQLW